MGFIGGTINAIIWHVVEKIPLETYSTRQATTIYVKLLFTFSIAYVILCILFTFKYDIVPFFVGIILSDVF